MTACAICGYINTALKVCEDKVNKKNVDIAISELENFCLRRKDENYENDFLKENNVKKIYDKLLEIKLS